MPARPMTPAHASLTHASGGTSFLAWPRSAGVGGPSVPVDADVRTQLELLSQMVEDISGELALEPLLARLVERACKLIGADDGAIGLYVPERDVIRTAASHAIPAAQLHAELPRGHGLTGRVLELGTPLRCRYGDLPHPVRTRRRK